MEKLNYEEMWDSLKASYAKKAREGHIKIMTDLMGMPQSVRD